MQEDQNPKLLVGTRNGNIIEFEMNVVYTKNSDYEENMDLSPEDSPDDLYEVESITFKSNLLQRNHAAQGNDQPYNSLDHFNQKRLLMSVHPKESYMATIGADKFLCLWDISTYVLVEKLDLLTTPTCVKWNNDGSILVIGQNNGTLAIYEFSTNNHGVDKGKGPKMGKPQLKASQILKESDTKTSVLNIEFSSNGEYMAVSYDHQKVELWLHQLNREENEHAKNKDGSFVVVYVHKESQTRIGIQTIDPKTSMYLRYSDIRISSLNQTFENSTNIFGKAVYFMAFSRNDKYLMLHSQIIDNNQIRKNDCTENPMVWDNVNNNSVKNYESHKEAVFKKMQFPNQIYGKYQFIEGNLKSSKKVEDDAYSKTVSQMNNNITLSAIATLTEYMFLGGTNGEIFIAKLIALSFDKNESADNIQKNRMCQARSYQAHVTFVNQIELDCTSNRLFTTGINDQCVFQWNISGSEDYWELDFNEYDMSVKDVFLAEVDPKEKYHSMIDELLTLRDEIVHMQEKIDETIQPEIFLELDKVIGRKAYNRRNNLLFTKDNNLVFNAGSMIVLLNIPPVKTDVPLTQKSLDEYFSQKFLEPDKGNIFSISPEISAIAICPNGKFLCTGTTQNNARILIWEMTSRTFIRSMTLSNCCTVLALEYAEDSRTIICVALSKNYTQCLYLIDTEKSKILASVNHLYSIPFKIKDMIFRPGSTTEFITCGVQHMTLWSYKGDLLNFKEFSIKMTNMKARVPDLEKSENEQTQQQNTVLKVTFLAIISVFDFIITGADDGRLYIWKDFSIIDKEVAHENIPILCMDYEGYKQYYDGEDNQEYAITFVTGGQNGTVIVWEFRPNPEDSEYRPTKYLEFNISPDPTTAIKDPQYHVQALQLRDNYAIAGTRNGDIHFFYVPTSLDGNEEIQKKISLDGTLVYSCHDNQIPKEADFSANNHMIFCITEKGLFTAWELPTLKRAASIYFGMTTVTMIVLKRFDKRIIIAFEHQILVLNIDPFEKVKDFNLECQKLITDVKVSKHEEKMAVAFAADQEGSAYIEIFKIDHTANKFISSSKIENIASKIEFMDFSEDNYYLMYKDNVTQKCFYDLTNSKKNDTLAIDFDMEWVSEGIKLSEKTSELEKYCEEDNTFRCMVRAGKESLIVTDEIGTIRIFEYPSQKGRGYYKLYTQHLSFITTCHISKNQEYLVTASRLDRCIFIWKVNKLNKDGRLENKQ